MDDEVVSQKNPSLFADFVNFTKTCFFWDAIEMMFFSYYVDLSALLFSEVFFFL